MSEDMTTEFVCGEWEHLNRMRSAKNQANVGITAAVNALIDIGEMKKMFNDIIIIYTFKGAS